MKLAEGQLEWLETNRSGSFAMGCVDRRLRRKYHALFTLRDASQSEPWNVLAEVRESLLDARGVRLLTDPLGSLSEHAELVSFQHAPHVTHGYRIDDVQIERTTRLSLDAKEVQLAYRMRGSKAPLRLSIEPLLRCRPLHALTFENPFLDGAITQTDAGFVMQPYAGMPELRFSVRGSEATFHAHGYWHSGMYYPWEASRGYPSREDLFCPGSFHVELRPGAEVVLVLGVGPAAPATDEVHATEPVNFGAGLERAAHQLIARSAQGTPEVMAGYPWPGPSSRDALIALPGLHLALDDAELTLGILEGLLAQRVGGLIPQHMPGRLGAQPSIEASLLFVRTVQWLERHESDKLVTKLMPEVLSVVDALFESHVPHARFDDGVGVWLDPGPHALTWMDAVIDGRPVTPRSGHAVEIDALAYNAIHYGIEHAQKKRSKHAKAWKARIVDAETRFLARFWDERRGYLSDTHDGERADPCLRPNQLWAIGLPFSPLSAKQRRRALEPITRELLVPPGLRTLSPDHASYQRHYRGNAAERDLACHQGSVFPWLLGPYADAVLAAHGPGPLEELLSPSLRFLDHHLRHEACIGQLSELFDGEAPHTAGSAPASVRSVSEVYRVFRLLHSVEGAVVEQRTAQ